MVIMNQIKIARTAAGLTQKQMSEQLEIPLRTIENWDVDKRSPAPWVAKLIVAELSRIAKKRTDI